MSVSQQDQQPQVPPEPPNVKIIECPCSQADRRAPDFSSWTNILKEPIMVKKGSEVRISQTFVDMRGMDSEIIQFQSQGYNQDNAHTLMFQHYTTNDGYNGKTCTYDYISHNAPSYPIVTDPGEGYIATATPYNPTWQDLNNNTFTDGLLIVKAFGFRPNNIEIVNGGKGYVNGDTFTTGNATELFEGYIQTDDSGTIVNIIFTKPTSNADPGGAVGVAIVRTLTFKNSVNPTEAAVIRIAKTTGGVVWHDFQTSFVPPAPAPPARGNGYELGTVLQPINDSTGAPIGVVDNLASLEVAALNIGNRSVGQEYYFDQGYNYERTPVFRWAPTFDVNSNFCYGNGLERVFDVHNTKTEVTFTSSHHEIEPGLSAGNMFMNKEDEFCSGVFHTPPADDNFNLFMPTLFFNNQHEFSLTPHETSGWVLSAPNFDMTDFANTKGNDLNVMPPGSIWQIYFKFAPPHTPTDADMGALETQLGMFASTVRVKTVTPKTTGTEVHFDSDLTGLDYIGAVTGLSSIIGTTGYPPLIPTTYNLVFTSKDDTGPDPVETPNITVFSDVTGVCIGFVISYNGIGNRKGMAYRVGTLPHYIVATQIDGTHGWDLPASRDLSLDQTQLSASGHAVEMYLIPVLNWSRFGTSGNSIRYGNESVSPEPGRYPVKFTTQAPAKDSYISNFLYRQNGDRDPTSNNYKVVEHNTDTRLRVTSELTGQIHTASLNYDVTGLHFFGNKADDNTYWYVDPTRDQYVMRINRAAIAFEDLPLYRYVNIRGYVTANPTPLVEVQLQTGGMTSDPTYYYITLITPSASYNSFTLNKMSVINAGLIGKTYVGQDPSTLGNLNGHSLDTVTLIYAQDPTSFNTSIGVRWMDSTGSLAVTGQQNFFNTNDINYDNLVANSNIFTKTSTATQESYNSGGYYFVSSSSADDYDINDNNYFNIGYDFMMMAQVREYNYSERQIATATKYNNFTNFTDGTQIWDYEPFYREKTLTITKDFTSPSDIAGIWTDQAHALTGAVDLTDGTTYVLPKSSGILQNEFITPVYGANNRIGRDGQYIIDYNMYPLSAGLEPGHCIGRNYVHDDCNWLSTTMILQLPKDANNRTYYDVYFRTPFTHLRGYDPLKEDSTYAGLPDKTPLNTVNTQGQNIGNTGVNLLDGTGPVAGGTTLVYELGDPVGGVATFDRQSYYPIYYLDPTKRDSYPKAKISQFIGTQNITLAFDSNISSFTFQYLHSPYTSPFVDGTGGQESMRVFYGNRLEGIVNHETVGGILVNNYCRPTFPRGIFTYSEVINNKTIDPVFPYGIDPLTSAEFTGRLFLNKLGFTDSDIGINTATGQILPNNTVLSYSLTPFQKQIPVADLDHPATGPETYLSYNVNYYGTTGSRIDASDAILTQIPAPENSAGIEANNIVVIPRTGVSRTILRKLGDHIYYPYSLNTNSDSFADKSIVRFDNATSTYGSVGGLRYSNCSRGMGLPNTLGSTTTADDSTIPVTLNPDCELYLAYTIQTQSSRKIASLLPVKLPNAYLIILSSLFKQPNMYLASAGFVNGGAIANKTFISGDYILSEGLTSFYAEEDMIISQIETQIKDSAWGVPSALGINSSVIYSITDYNPTPAPQMNTVGQQQQEDMMVMEMVQQHLHSPETSRLEQLNDDFYNLGLDIMTNQSSDIIDAVRNQINAHDLQGLTPQQRVEFLRTPEGQVLLDNVTDVQAIRQHILNIGDAQGTPGEFAVTRRERGNIQARTDNIIARTPQMYFQAPAPDDDTPTRPDPLLTYLDVTPSRNEPFPRSPLTPREQAVERGRQAINRAGYTPEEIARMEEFAGRMRFGERIQDRNRAYDRELEQRNIDPFKGPSESGIGTSIATDIPRMEELGDPDDPTFGMSIDDILQSTRRDVGRREDMPTGGYLRELMTEIARESIDDERRRQPETDRPQEETEEQRRDRLMRQGRL